MTEITVAGEELGCGEHGWATESVHRTSIGEIRYVRCVVCGVRRVDVRERAALVPRAESRTVGLAAEGVIPVERDRSGAESVR